MSFYITRNVPGSFASVMDNLKNKLHANDYLIAADIDVQGALKQKLDADLPQISIIGTNTPKVGLQLFSSDPKLGTLLPFSIVLHDLGENYVEVSVVNPEFLFDPTPAPSARSTYQSEPALQTRRDP